MPKSTMEEAGTSIQLEYRISFYVNNQLVTLLESDGSHYQKLTENDEYTILYIQELIKSNSIKVDGPLISIRRLLENGNENEIFPTRFTTNTPEALVQVKDSEWKVPETKYILDKYEHYLPQIDPMKMFKTKRKMWHKISDGLQNILGVVKTDIQCENRYKTVLKRKTKAQGQNRTRGETRQNIEYEDELKKISAIDDSVEPEQLRGVGKCIRKEPLCEQNDTQSSSNVSTSEESEEPPKKKVKSVSKPRQEKKSNLGDTLLNIQREKEMNRERRHQEKMKLIADFVNALNRKRELIYFYEVLEFIFLCDK